MCNKIYIYRIKVNLKGTKYFFGWLNYCTSEHLANFSMQFQNAVWFGVHFIASGACLASLLSFSFQIEAKPTRHSRHNSCTWSKADDRASLILYDYPFNYFTLGQIYGYSPGERGCWSWRWLCLGQRNSRLMWWAWQVELEVLTEFSSPLF